MAEVSPSYTLAEHIYHSFQGANGILTPEEIAGSGVAVFASTRQIRVAGELDGQPAVQNLTKTKNNNLCFSTLFVDEKGTLRSLTIAPQSNIDMEVLTSSLFMHTLVRIALARSEA